MSESRQQVMICLREFEVLFAFLCWCLFLPCSQTQSPVCWLCIDGDDSVPDRRTVIAIDPADLAPEVTALPNVRHLRMLSSVSV